MAPLARSLALANRSGLAGDKKYIAPAIAKEIKTAVKPAAIKKLNIYIIKSGNFVSAVKV